MKRRIKHKSGRLAALCIAVLAGLLAAQAATAGDLSDPAFRKQISKQFPGVKPDDITPSPMPGVYQVMQHGVVAYISADGRFLLDGDLVNLDSNVNLSDQARQTWRRKQLAKLDERNMVIYGPANASHTITEFTDVDCAYCRLLYSHLKQLTAAGIRVRYLFFPLHGPGSKSYRQAEAVWCSADRKQAMDRAMRGKTLKASPDCPNPVAAQYGLAMHTLKLRGTPTIIDQQGRILPSGLPVSELVKKIVAGKKAGDKNPAVTIR